MPVLRDYEGRSIRLTEERWAHISEHPEMVMMRAAVEETLGGPKSLYNQQVTRRQGSTTASILEPSWEENTFAPWSS